MGSNSSPALAGLSTAGEKEIDRLIQDAWELVISNADDSLRIIEKAREFSQAAGYQNGLDECLLLDARYEGEKDRYFEALQKTSQAYQTYVETGNIAGQIKACRIFGFLYSRHGKYNSALEYLFIAIRLIKDNLCRVEEGLYPIEVFLLNNIAFIYAETGRSGEALNFFYQAFELAKKSGGAMISTILTNIAEMHLNTGDAQMALRYNKMALTEAKRQKLGHLDLHNCYNSFGLIYHKMGMLDMAVDSFTHALDAAVKGESKYSQIVSRLALSRLHLQAGDADKALSVVSPAYRLSGEIQANVLLRDICIVMAQAYEHTGDMANALSYYKKHMELNLEISSREVEQRLSDYTAEFKAEQAMKDAEIYRLKNIELKQKSMELEESNRNITAIGEIGQKITASLDIEVVLNTLYDCISKLMDANLFGVGLYDDTKDAVYFRMIIEDRRRLPEMEFNVAGKRGYVYDCIRNNREIVVNDEAQDDPNHSGTLIVTNGKRPHSFIFFPLALAGNIIGVLTIQSYHPNAYTRNNVETIRALRAYVAIALNNSQRSEELRQKARELELLSKTDPLTGLYNRRYIIEKMEEERVRFRRYGKRFTVIIADIDLFKKVNDVCGHDCGDYVLIEVARTMKQLLREQDCLARWGGEEFLLLLPETDAAGGAVLADRLRTSIYDRVLEYRKKKVTVSVTLGVSEFGGGVSVDEAIRNADNALYEGKKRGRNCVVVNA